MVAPAPQPLREAQTKSIALDRERIPALIAQERPTVRVAGVEKCGRAGIGALAHIANHVGAELLEGDTSCRRTGRWQLAHAAGPRRG